MDRPRNFPEASFVDRPATVALRAPARLHLGFLDPAGSLGRSFGSVGLVIGGFETEVEISASPVDRVTANGPAAHAEIERAAACLRMLRGHTGRRDPLHLRLEQVLPAHAGFGSGTQLALAIGRAFALWHGLSVPTATLAQWLGRGLRSGIGIAGFDHGGLIVDGGPGANGAPAAVLSRIPLPEAWRVLIVQDSAQKGLSGDEERQRIASLPPLPRALAADICHQVLMCVLPGAAAADFAPFAAGVTRIQQVLGEHFASAQGGRAFASEAVGCLLGWVLQHRGEHLAAIGQSSWGPTGFAIFPSQARAEAAMQAMQAAGVVAPSLALRVVSGRNAGATLLDRRPSSPLISTP
ncbi:beta-ribofuranosylaminobenzene 5'-phosphate synthase [Variovorax sp. J2P1-59]|uniref:beta-ribofuranosylaminobenzene 5'-phosphate synthase family protein n=1 Tax=Variovorax flavidus TaxID=3053501 RepID=UPI002574D2D5|nr:beta-ribofuranosylaminobenzene 5'-phosphate synthase family protein [Variovorax sp. J2P1-59]MDM0073246.1 beta-ribofuranosylaminobenzene 5'-phosphate synthase [Variovorax sp. J2P1-59]